MFTLAFMTNLNAYLMFDGDCAEAMRFYEKTLGGKLSLMNHAESPMKDQMPPGMAERIMHARLELPDGGVLMASDWMVGQPYPGKNGFSLSLGYQDAEEARRVFDALSEGGRVTMPLQKTFWAEAFGMFADRFGTPWMVNCQSAGA